jgi:hypothetical protein
MSIEKISDRSYKVRWRTPEGASRSKRFARKRDAEDFEATVRTTITDGTYIDSTTKDSRG